MCSGRCHVITYALIALDLVSQCVCPYFCMSTYTYIIACLFYRIVCISHRYFMTTTEEQTSPSTASESPAQVKQGRFFNWNIRFGAFRRVWTFMSKIQKFRREMEGRVEEGVWRRETVIFSMNRLLDIKYHLHVSLGATTILVESLSSAVCCFFFASFFGLIVFLWFATVVPCRGSPLWFPVETSSSPAASFLTTQWWRHCLD